MSEARGWVFIACYDGADCVRRNLECLMAQEPRQASGLRPHKGRAPSVADAGRRS